jgi:TetR/AcrR family transcriptional regulator, transcriptional repressor for nem operon
MGHSQADKALSREKILREAAEQVRNNGLESISVGKLMRSVELTHGGFYNHFDSRSDLLAQALERALTEGRKASLAGAEAQTQRSFEAVLRSFLSRSHRDSRAGGCAIAALASDVARADERARSVMSLHIDGFVAQIAKALDTDDEGDAMLAASAMIGALLLSRVQVDARRSDALLKTVRERLLALQRASAGQPGAAAPSRAARNNTGRPA